jgi:hypothetical protein
MQKRYYFHLSLFSHHNQQSHQFQPHYIGELSPFQKNHYYQPIHQFWMHIKSHNFQKLHVHNITTAPPVFTGKSHNSFNRFIKYAKEVLLSSLPFLQSLKFVASLDLNLKCSSKFSLVKC